MRPMTNSNVLIPAAQSGAADQPGDDSSADAQPSHGFEHSAERDAESHQAIGEHSREIERKIGERMPDRK